MCVYCDWIYQRPSVQTLWSSALFIYKQDYISKLCVIELDPRYNLLIIIVCIYVNASWTFPLVDKYNLIRFPSGIKRKMLNSLLSRCTKLWWRRQERLTPGKKNKKQKRTKTCVPGAENVCFEFFTLNLWEIQILSPSLSENPSSYVLLCMPTFPPTQINTKCKLMFPSGDKINIIPTRASARRVFHLEYPLKLVFD